MVMDVITGIFKAIKNHNLWSRKSLFGYARKMLVLVVILKLRKPYLDITDKAIKFVQEELKVTKHYMREHNLRILKGPNDMITTNYKFFHGGYEPDRRYLNVRLMYRTEDLLQMYLAK